MMKRSIFLASAAALALTGLATAGLALADKSPAPKNASGAILTNVKAGTPTRMEYELRAKAYIFFIPATGRATFTTDLKPDSYTIDSRVKVTGIADWFVNYDMNIHAEGETRENELKTRTYVSQNKDGKKNRKVELAIGETDFSMNANPRFGNLGDPAATTEQVLKTNDPITALITFALEPRAPGADPCGGPIRIFDGRQLTYLHLKNAGTKRVDTPVWTGDAIECHVTMDKIAGYKKGEADNDNLTGIDGPLRMWLAPLDNGASVPIKIAADSKKIGDVTLTAKKLRFEPLVTTEAAAGQDMAEN
ncbi:DUF3108 domain-containing protein [Hyphomonas adhaerens]|uniref:DUF3108 domain-containing protein n=1 Tax=Hyphomonas adhaerens TaxID=81029 RepID=UPI0023577A12|nr:DUF3108 domain-containing protein [Hyphomonas adhaerens]